MGFFIVIALVITAFVVPVGLVWWCVHRFQVTNRRSPVVGDKSVLDFLLAARERLSLWLIGVGAAVAPNFSGLTRAAGGPTLVDTAVVNTAAGVALITTASAIANLGAVVRFARSVSKPDYARAAIAIIVGVFAAAAALCLVLLSNSDESDVKAAGVWIVAAVVLGIGSNIIYELWLAFALPASAARGVGQGTKGGGDDGTGRSS